MERRRGPLPNAGVHREIDPLTHNNFSQLVRHLGHLNQNGNTPEGQQAFQDYNAILLLMQGESTFEIAPLGPDHNLGMGITHGAFVIDPTSEERRLVQPLDEPTARSFIGHVFPLNDPSGLNNLAQDRPIAFQPFSPSPQESS